MIHHATRAYLWLRRRVRDVVIRTPVLDETVGAALRRLEQRAGGVGILRRHARNVGGVLQVRGLTLHYREQDLAVVAPLLAHEDYEPETRDAIERILKPGMSFVDLGAHIGFLTLVAARRVAPSGHVYAFEPIANTAEVLARNVAANGFDDVVTVVRQAVADSPQILAFVLSEKHSVSNKIARAVATPAPTTAVQATSLDAYFGALGWPPVHLVKMDVEGAELDAVRGMRELSRRSDDLKVIFEFHHANLVQTGVTAEALFAELQQLGFTRFTRLHRVPQRIIIPDHIPEAMALAERVNFNVLCERG